MALAIREIEPETVAPPAAPLPPRPTILDIHRVSVVDIGEIGPWLIGRLKEKYPHHTDQALMSWLRSSTTDNECWFGRVKGRVGSGIGLFTIHRRFLMRPWVEEAFCLAMTEDDVEYTALLYRPVRDWAVGQGCEKIIVQRFSDCTKGMITEEIGESRRVAETWVRLLPE